MNWKEIIGNENEKPLDILKPDGGFCGIFRTIGCIGDSLSSGEFESQNEKGEKGYHDYYEYSWGQYMARRIGSKVYNFSRGGMSAKWYCETYADENGFWDKEKACQAYILALGVNDVNSKIEIGTAADVDPDDYRKNKENFAGYYAQIITRYKEIQPKAKFFLMTMPRNEHGSVSAEHTRLLYELAELFDYTYVLDFDKYAPVYDCEFKSRFYLGGHLNAAGYMLTAEMVMSYIDYIIRHNMEDFSQAGFIGTEFHNCTAKW